MFHPSRGGVRGGQDQFSWDNVKEDKYRECYLGHSLKAPVGRWQKGKDLTWYAKNRDEDALSRSRAELIAIKQAEEDAMAEALGLKKRTVTESDISARELRSVLKKEQDTNDEDAAEEADVAKGLGFKQYVTVLLLLRTTGERRLRFC
ncbi:MAG: kinase phosphorylation protein-domain-containing protein [Olpidium bornovanus]|uniref:Kinase phosphorylation protein-domain-containing protein n=1 Tax=Olpidium bornovanus TaxID=278681 RepID=A0A8H7ZP12_9FUNG|nr:MAG: kinase phosphorylation protein-domain-containing protein [Olpidium bornovanus]